MQNKRPSLDLIWSDIPYLTLFDLDLKVRQKLIQSEQILLTNDTDIAKEMVDIFDIFCCTVFP